MKRYLLFDSGCNTCSQLAQAIEQEADGWLTARSLRDPEMQTLLDEAKPGWQWEPTLLEVDEEKANAATGLALMMKIVTGLGVRKAWCIFKLIGQGKASGRVQREERRRFLRYGGAFLLSAILWPKQKTVQAEDSTNTIPIVDSVPIESEERIELAKRAINSPELQLIGSVHNLEFDIFDIHSATAVRNTLADGRQELVVKFNATNGDFVRYLERSAGYVRSKGGYYQKDAEGGYLLTSLIINGENADLPQGGVRVMVSGCSGACSYEQRSACNPCGSYVQPCEGWCCVCTDMYGNETVIGCDWEWCGDCGNFC